MTDRGPIRRIARVAAISLMIVLAPLVLYTIVSVVHLFNTGGEPG